MQQVLRIGDGRMHAEHRGLLVCHTIERPDSQSDYTCPHVVECAPFSFAQMGLLVLVFPSPTPCL